MLLHARLTDGGQLENFAVVLKVFYRDFLVTGSRLHKRGQETPWVEKSWEPVGLYDPTNVSDDNPQEF